MANHNEIGEKGEVLAEHYLIKKGYTILAKNFRYRKTELDIIANDEDTLVIVEVKTRQNHYLAHPGDTVSKTKQRHLIVCANAYIQQMKVNQNVRFDIITVILNANKQRIYHIKDAFYPQI